MVKILKKQHKKKNQNKLSAKCKPNLQRTIISVSLREYVSKSSNPKLKKRRKILENVTMATKANLFRLLCPRKTLCKPKEKKKLN